MGQRGRSQALYRTKPIVRAARARSIVIRSSDTATAGISRNAKPQQASL